MRCIALGLVVPILLASTAFAAPIQTVFVIAMENHNFT